jgi:two-component system nitrate/nitrite response regulator NarL
MPPIRLLLADDHTLFRRGLQSLLTETGEFEVLAEAHSGPEAVRLAAELKPDVVLMDLHMPGGNGLAAVSALQKTLPALPVLILTVSESDADVLDAIRAGAKGYLLKNADTEELFAAIRRAAAGQLILDTTLTETLFRYVARSTTALPPSPLTLRETGILQMIAAGATNREIAVQLSLSENTVKTHITHILEKLQASSRSEAVSLAQHNGWIAPNP